MSFPKKIGENIGKNVSENLSCKYSQNIFRDTKRSVTDALETTSKRLILKTAEATDDL